MSRLSAGKLKEGRSNDGVLVIHTYILLNGRARRAFCNGTPSEGAADRPIGT
jgi:hypothetical protein